MKKPKKNKKSVVKDFLTPNTPTQERQMKDDYEGEPKKRRRADPLKWLERTGKITAADKEAAQRWLVDWEFAREGYGDFKKDPLTPKAEEEIRVNGYGNAATEGIARAKAWARILEVKKAIGIENHVLIWMMLVEGYGFAIIGMKAYPLLGAGHIKASNKGAEAIQKLAEYYGYRQSETDGAIGKENLRKAELADV